MVGTRIRHYRLVRKIGEGAHGEVYEGVHAHDEAVRVAVKVVIPSLARDDRFVEALKTEWRQLERMHHRNVVRVRELVVDGGHVALVLELLRGEGLHARIARGPLTPDDAAAMVSSILEGLGHAHAQGVLHRDVKPQNIHCCDDGRVVLLDFGVARAADGTTATESGQIVGTLSYVAPERFRGDGGSERSDVYAAGLIAWELLAGRAACPEGEAARKLQWHLMEGVGDGGQVARALPGCPTWLAEVIATLSHVDPARRPADGHAALALLRRRHPGPYTVEPPTPPGQGRRAGPGRAPASEPEGPPWYGRHHVWAPLAGVLLGAGGVWLYMDRPSVARTELSPAEDVSLTDGPDVALPTPRALDAEGRVVPEPPAPAPVAVPAPVPAGTSSAPVSASSVSIDHSSLDVSYLEPDRFHSVTVRIRNVSTQTLEVEVPAGTYLRNANAKQQSLVTVESAQARLQPGAVTDVRVETACTNAGWKAPDRATTFTRQESPKAGVATFVRTYALYETSVVTILRAVNWGQDAVRFQESQTVTRQTVLWEWYGAEDDAMVTSLVEGFDFFAERPDLARAYVTTTSTTVERVVRLVDDRDEAALARWAAGGAWAVGREAVDLGGRGIDYVKQKVDGAR
jgi:tRNA A-37 threonylcarbamoyl transferase component Bud32